MSWFDAAGLTNFAKTALTTAQKTIDKALDIKDDLSLSGTSAEKPEADNFFEAFGLGSKVSQTLSQTFKKPTKTEKTTVASSHEPTSNAGFWTDTWGSFFEADKSLSEVQPSEDPNTSLPSFPQQSPSIPSPRHPTSESAVSSQPVRSSLFPENVPVTSKQEEHFTEEIIESSSSILNPSCSVDPLTTEPSILDSVDNDKDTVISPSVPVASSICLDQSLLREIDKDVQDIEDAMLDKTLTDSEGDSLTMEASYTDIPKDIKIIEDHLSIENTKPIPNEYDIIDLSEKCLEGTFSEKLSDLVTSSDNMGLELSDSTSNVKDVELLKDPVQDNESISTEDGQLSSDLLLTTKESSVDTIHFSDSFHILNSCIVNNVSDWVSAEDIPHSEDSVHESESTEEANSKNGDTQSNSSKDESETDVKECDVKSSGSGGSHEMSGSFVKCSIEEADMGSHRGQSPLSTATSERSYGTKLESEQNTSGDEIETTTSSDIEILSAPNGENGDRNSVNWVPRILRMRRSESPTSECSKDNSMPILHEGETLKPPHASSHQRHHRKAFGDTNVKQLIQQQEEMQTLLEAREKKTLELSQENLKLQETVETLEKQLSETKASDSKNAQIVSSVTKECTQRLAQMEGQLLKVSKERDSFRNEIEELQNELVQRIRINVMDDVMKEKDQQIKELMEEGEKLSKKELTHTTIIKKLRVKEEDLEHTIKNLKERLDENSKEVERLRKSLGAKDEQEKKHIDAIRQLNGTINKQEKDIINFKSRLEDFAEKELSQKKSLEGTFLEVTELRQKIETKDFEIQELKLSIEMAGKEKLREGIDQANKEKESLAMQIEDLRASLKQNEMYSNKRETSLKEDITRLQLRLQESEDRNEKLTKNISTATRPVVRQVEVLQSRYNSLVDSSEKIEKTLMDKLHDCQSQLALASDRERLANEKCLKMSEELTKFEKENTTLRQEKFKLTSEFDILNSRLFYLEENTHSDLVAMDRLKEEFAVEKSKLVEDKEKLAQELQKSSELITNDRQLIQSLQEELKSKDYKIHSIENLSHNSSPNASIRSSVDSLNNWIHEGASERKLSTPVNNYRISVYDSLRNGCSASILENLQSQLKQREGEITELQYEISRLEREKEFITQELVQATTQNEDLQNNLHNFKEVQKSHDELNQKHNKLLEMYGEEVEEKEELSEAIAMYKAQIKELLDNK